jgi:hypothetical protein
VANLQALQQFAATHDFGLTAPLSHEEVGRLAAYWLPEMRFYYDERFHPITLDDMFAMVEEQFAAMSPTAQNAWKVQKFVRAGPAAGTTRSFDPPVVHVPDGVIQQGNFFRPVVRVLNEGTPARDALKLPEVGSGAVVTHGASFRSSNQFFGPLKTLSEGNTSAAGDPFLPRADEPDPEHPGERRSRITVMAQLQNLFELLKYELTVAGAGDYPPDAMRGAFNISGNLLKQSSPQAFPWPPEAQRQYLLSLIAAYESGGVTPIPDPPFGWRLDRVAWDAVTRFAFLEYYFFYAYNDFERYQTAIFDNEHEGDDEGCCLVFDRNVINLAAAGNDPDALFRAVPHSIICSVHEEYQDADIFKFIAPPLPDPGNPNRLAREAVEFKVYIAGGSHATYLTGGTHDLVDFQDTWGYVDENAPILYVVFPLVLAASIILAIIEHFVDTEDFTSDEGVHSGPDEIVGDYPAKVAAHTQVLPMSADNHIYMPSNEALLQLRAYAGKWGGHDGTVDDSPPFTPKTGRFFRKLLDKL